ncbi:hypothetical protein QBC46DRAFT_274488, partial [Diplogelasinospora grovesii]
LGIKYDDIKLDNFYIITDSTGERVIILNLKSAWELSFTGIVLEKFIMYLSNRLLSY